jgi:hypothetical protein
MDPHVTSYDKQLNDAIAQILAATVQTCVFQYVTP